MYLRFCRFRDHCVSTCKIIAVRYQLTEIRQYRYPFLNSLYLLFVTTTTRCRQKLQSNPNANFFDAVGNCETIAHDNRSCRTPRFSLYSVLKVLQIQLNTNLLRLPVYMTYRSEPIEDSFFNSLKSTAIKCDACVTP